MECLGDSLLHFRNSGEALLEAKQGCEHGEWLKWLSENFEGSHDTALNYMRIAQQWTTITAQQGGNSERVRNLSLRGALQIAGTAQAGARAGTPAPAPAIRIRAGQRPGTNRVR